MNMLSENLREKIDECVRYMSAVDEAVFDKAVQKLAYYENLEESGRLVVLPAKVGDVLWTYANFPREYIYPFEVRGISVLEKEITTDRVGTVKWDDFGRTVFLTRKEAEKALEAMNNDAHT